MKITPLRLVFAGTPQFSVPALDALHAAGHSIVAVYTQPDRPAGRGRELTASPVKQRALALGLHVEQPATLKTPEPQHTLAAFAPDVMVVVAYGLILPQAVLEVPRLGCVNIHASLLPRWRGAAPIQRAVLAGDERTGISIMLMDAGLDTGPELLRREVKIDARETAGELHDRLRYLGADAVVEALEGWTSGRLSPQPQASDGATYATKIRKEEALIDWSRPAIEIDRQVRAFNPWPVAETRFGDEQVRVWRAAPLPDAPSTYDPLSTDAALPAAVAENLRAAPPGVVIDAPPGRLFVATGDGTLELLTVQFPGRKALPVAELLHAREFSGARFGS